MKTYKIYYHIPSEEMFSSADASVDHTDLELVNELVKYVRTSEDQISIYANDSMVRVEIYKGADDDAYDVELHNARDGVNYFRAFSKSNLFPLDRGVLDAFILDPKKYSFEAESF